MDKRRTFHLRDGTKVEYHETDDMKSRRVTSPCGAFMEDISHKHIIWIKPDKARPPAGGNDNNG